MVWRRGNSGITVGAGDWVGKAAVDGWDRGEKCDLSFAHAEEYWFGFHVQSRLIRLTLLSCLAKDSQRVVVSYFMLRGTLVILMFTVLRCV